ncbi:MAG: hypothetical protein A3H88_02765 [Candidatus Blackburnbacteria bacterium RIFCSPLOWO2_02_FULL_44_9]|uniref:Uncharacterized protein n=1 Tax=Candidatus Blackburnbacteria bacterium RIFCSPHIGHO2_02_FULL_44_20 TaxID=1797516 RepID=A0A1G1V5R6_9BACT|nr:MAG: hypothetical protein A3D26_02855 [Candidatus Blackburnbacteria bacterium RIFCSPHIGHO2_02_FULL_44_20]OGY11890.1 MAG: hypothetical protein A3E16_03815 [Candidatus Blackburnbacteria bacterium RIFCSPHIGHO2_12_FULL_44_25]OGY17063.1 MAG: hypothetical protein A3H88_02765 [Candidatus Blackburnbacteria bacterium RIFCSPLOWO2_02_FULL_44_9]
MMPLDDQWLVALWESVYRDAIARGLTPEEAQDEVVFWIALCSAGSLILATVVVLGLALLANTGVMT